MISRRIGYLHASTTGKNTDCQLENVHLDRKFEDKAGTEDAERPGLEQLLQFAREGDTVIVHSMDDLARNLDDLRRLVRQMTERGIGVEFVKEGLTFTAEDSPMSQLLLNVQGAFSQLEHTLINERQRKETR